MATDITTKKYVTGLMNFGVIALSIVLIIWISLDTFESQNILQDYRIRPK